MKIRLLCLLLLAGCAKPQPGKITLALNWFPEAEHGGYFAAQAQGFYREAGLDVDILSGGPDTPVIARVVSGAVTFGVENADGVLFGRAEGAPVVAIMAPIQSSPRCIMVHESSGITNLLDLRDLTLAMSARGAFSHYLRRHAALPGVKIVPYPGNVSQFLVNSNYAQQGYVFSEPFIARSKGATPRVLPLSDIGFNPYTSVLVASEKTLRDQPGVVARFVQASLRGWESYVANPDAANAEIHRLNPEMESDILAFGADALRPLTGPAPVGSMSLDRWTALRDQLVEIDLIKTNAVKVEEAFTTRFLMP